MRIIDAGLLVASLGERDRAWGPSQERRPLDQFKYLI